jgi:hypothetical protein
MNVILDFPYSYVIDVEPGWPDINEEVASFNCRVKNVGFSGEFQGIRFYPKSGGSWFGQFEKGKGKIFASAVFSTPNADEVCVIAYGAGYWVNAETRHVEPIACDYLITQVEVSKDTSSILMCTFWDLYSFQGPLPTWINKRVAMDDLKITGIDNGVILAEGFVKGCTENLKIDAQTGQLM